MSELKHTINLIVGDWSHDGHNMTDTVTIHSNLNVKELEAAYKKGAKKIGVDPTKEIAEEYEDNKISKEAYDKLVTHGFDVKDLIDVPDPDESEDSYDLYSSEAFSEIWLFVAKTGNPDFEYEMLEESDNSINIGGYGLFT
jgi:hypothetical protein